MTVRVTRVSLIVLADPPPEPLPEFDGCVHDHEDRGQNQLIYIYRKDDITALLRAYLAEIQVLEDAMCSLPVEFFLRYASGAQLDILGRIVGQPRGQFKDPAYRAMIGGRIAANRSSGTGEHVIRAIKAAAGAVAVGGPNVPIEFRDEPPAAFTVSIGEGIDTAAGIELAKLVHAAKGAGVRALLHWKGPGNTFRFSQTGTAIQDSPNGFGNGRLSAVSDGRRELEPW